ncbi:HNH endonuclease signature motif containing protein [Alcanivorax jadensis]|uniref:HNH endonuclease signature motif containing protein n=1 Tax=Alcanivorax jadensis TaxID=64988 RepID=UPI0039C8BD83
MPGKAVKAHRFSYETFESPIPEGMQLDHLCRVRNCVNPRHLEPVTNRENVRRGFAARPAQTHCRSGGHELTEENIYLNPRGHRECRICRREAAQRQKQKRAEHARD